MKHGTSYFVGVVVGIVFAAVLFFVYIRKNGKCEFDERQELVRGRAFKYGFFSLLTYLLIFGGFYGVKGGDVKDFYIWLGIGMCGSVLIFAVYTIWHDGYFSIYEKPKHFTLLFGAVGILNLICSLRDSDIRIWNLEVGVLASVVAGTIVVKNWKDRREEE